MEIGFNVAASIKMRKFLSAPVASGEPMKLQCGRIYKDAEIQAKGSRASIRNHGFNVAASIKMRKSKVALLQYDRRDRASMWPHL